jgi:hypothetical protein
MNQTVAQIARHYGRGSQIPEPMLNHVLTEALGLELNPARAILHV